ncbi:MAG: N-6 DNA methylase [Acidobacteria bacterium]|nr:N-6 DNA methylase [Acidobacteriota bacterium]
MSIEWTEPRLVAAALGLGARDVPGWSAAEQKLARAAQAVPSDLLNQLRDQIRAGEDPLGEVFSDLRCPEMRRELGATYTPLAIVDAMLAWAAEQDTPARVIDPGAGSGRFLLRAARRFKSAELVGVEIDPLAAAIARGNLSAAGLKDRSRVVLGDYRAKNYINGNGGRSLFIGNPPYVRHHLIEPRWKEWLVARARDLSLSASQLAGLHVYFFLATALRAQTGDFGALITAAEWLDVNYGALVRELFLGKLGGERIVVIEPTATPFPDAATTAAITAFHVASRPKSVRLRRVKRLKDLDNLDGGRLVRRERLESERRWSRLTYNARGCPDGFVELGELCRVHRGQVTGANKVWIADHRADDELPETVLYPSVTKARELIAAEGVLSDASKLHRVVDLPEDLDVLGAEERRTVDRFLRRAKRLGAHKGYIARHRRAWWSVGLRKPAPILATYMARRPPAFVRNLASARHLNIAHGLYPRERLTERALSGLVDHLAVGTNVIDGRTYAGGLTKFEPREMERLFVPGPQLLDAATA